MNLLSKLFLLKRQDANRKFLEKGSVLDIGSSINPVCSEAITLDINRNKKPMICASVISLPFREKSFDNVNFTEVLEHIEPKFQNIALKEVRRVTKNMVISTPSLFPTWNIIWFFWENTIQKEYRHTHIGQLRTQLLFNKLAETGFRVKQWKRVLFFDMVIKCE